MSSLQERRADHRTTIWSGITTAAPSSTGFVIGNSTATATLMPTPNAVGFRLSAASNASSTNGTLDLVIQTRVGSTVWLDVLAFPQVASSDAAGAAQVAYGKLSAGSTQAMFVPGTSLAASNVRHLIGDEWRCRYNSVSPSTAVLWTCVVSALPM